MQPSTLGTCSQNSSVVTSPKSVRYPHHQVRVAVTPAFVLDSELATAATENLLKETAARLPDMPSGVPWHLGALKYGASVVPHDPDRIITHPLAGRIVDADAASELAQSCIDAADEVAGSWVLFVFADVIFDACCSPPAVDRAV